MRTRTRRIPNLSVAAIVLAGFLSLWSLAVMPGCGSSGDKPTGGAVGNSAGTANADVRTLGGDGLLAPPPVRSAGDVNGIEVRTWTVDPLGGPVASALADARLAEPRLDPEDERRWRRHGFRLVEVPVEQIADIESSLPHVDSIRRLWLGQPTTWTGLASGRLASDRGVLGGRPVPVRTALVVRSWVEPSVQRAPIRVEIALTGRPLDGIAESPLIMAELLLSHRLEPGTALVIVPAPPDETWVAQAEGDEGHLGEEPTVGPTPDGNEGAGRDESLATGVLQPSRVYLGDGDAESDDPIGDAAGPVPAEPMQGVTFGEALLIEPGRILSVPPRPARGVIVIVPGAR